MLKQKMKVPFRKLKYIHHISDIQIRNLKRHREYEEVFNKLYEEVKKNPNAYFIYKNGINLPSYGNMKISEIRYVSNLINKFFNF